MQTHTCSYVSRTRCVRQISSSGVHKLRNTTGSVLAYIAQRGYAHAASEVLARLGSSIAAMKALDHAHEPRLVIIRHDAREANQRRWFIYGLNTPPVVYEACIKYTTSQWCSHHCRHANICSKYIL